MRAGRRMSRKCGRSGYGEAAANRSKKKRISHSALGATRSSGKRYVPRLTVRREDAPLKAYIKVQIRETMLRRGRRLDKAAGEIYVEEATLFGSILLF